MMVQPNLDAGWMKLGTCGDKLITQYRILWTIFHVRHVWHVWHVWMLVNELHSGWRVMLDITMKSGISSWFLMISQPPPAPPTRVGDWGRVAKGLEGGVQPPTPNPSCFTCNDRGDAGNVWEEDISFLTSGALSHLVIAMLENCF